MYMFAFSSQNKIPEQNHPHSGKPRKQNYHCRLWILWRMQPKIWQLLSMENAYGRFWSSPHHCLSWKLIFLYARRIISLNWFSRWPEKNKQKARNSNWRTNGRFAMVRSPWKIGMECEYWKRNWLPLWIWCNKEIHSSQQFEDDSESTSDDDGRISKIT